MGKKPVILRISATVLGGLLLLFAFYLTSLYNYLLFHSIIELFTIIVAAGIFVIAWNARSYMNNDYLLFIGVSSIFVAWLDLFHALAYKGMGVFPSQTANLTTQLWTAARYVQSISWLIAPLFFGKRLRLHLQFTVYILVIGLLFLSIFYWQNFPIAYVEGIGLTTFKKTSEYIISLFFLGSISFLFWKRQEFDPGVFRLLIISLILTIGSEIAFASYVGIYGEINIIGHFLKLAAFYFLYKAIIETGLVKPYSILLRDLKHSQDKLREQAVTLQIRNEELTHSESQLREDAVILKTRNEELDAFAHTVAHDLKNPLSIIIATADVITGGSKLARQELDEFLQQIRSIAFEMNGIIDNLLLLSEVRKVDAPMEAVDMAKAVTRVQYRLNYMLKERHGHIIVPETWPRAIGYGPWIEEIWANYISNALKYGGKSPRVELGASIQTDGMIRFWARDFGPGIPLEEQSRLFVPFTQIGKHRGKGHGLGLSIVYHIVEKLGGHVGVQSEAGKGCTFYFTLPAYNDASHPSTSTKLVEVER